ncbi:2'-5' RNA ligase family protein [Kocuria tytonicola]|uniref:2'-5' RNA ligase family protein n=1 Tax=Kocuria tytonicola TaxID=2055946 RepID=A0A3L9L6J9_9MICC|nr:2'-5' RNA ligase family protein [Kocuria tytonicola]RLY94315.1 2'-5' RNA ligase family protein [Kocuria tytonicola]
MPAHSLDLVLAPEHDRAVRARWDALREAGLPSLATHRSSSNAPHLTVLAAPDFEEAVLERARSLVRPLLPCPLPVTGLTVLGSGPFVLAEALAVPPDLHTAAAELRRMCGGDDRPWVPHVTLAKRLDAAGVGRALEVFSDVAPPQALEAVALRRWDPDRRETTVEVP